MSESKTIDAAIEDINEQINLHRGQARRLLSLVMTIGVAIISLCVLIYMFQAYYYAKEAEQLSKIAANGFSILGASPQSRSTTMAQKQSPPLLPASSASQSSITHPNTPLSMPSGSIVTGGGLVGGVSVGGSIGPSGTSSFNSASTESKVAASVEKILYVLSALFALIFGVLMAIYRFHLTEISRSEQYKLGLHRIRIAANNHNHAGFNTEVRAALTLGAFEFSTGKEKKVESPLPGHPASDLATALTNKLLDAIEIKVTPKKE